ncbi:hypothetical protein [Blastococcus deserti]|uniref:Polyketide cyclase/dehydrase/lipid transport protein n=1 Tax=Blastococcus deserti TaxID=2259033 RepID=A0ABW4XIE0_9ACTN
MDLDDVVPHPEHVTRQSRVIDARRSVVWEELHSVRLRSLPVTMVLGGVRALPLMVARKWRGGLDQSFLDVIPLPVLSSEPPSAVVFGGLLQPWRLSGGERPPTLDAAGVREWAEPGWVKVGMEFRLTPAVGGTHLSIETRVAATDPATRRRFDRYWILVGPGSSAIRWELLAAVAIRAEARAAG